MDVLLPTYNRSAALALTLAGLSVQQVRLRVIIADQSDEPVAEAAEVVAMTRTLRHNGHDVEVHRRPDRRGVAEQRQFLLEHATSEFVLCLDDDVWLQPWAVSVMVELLSELDAGMVGMAPIGLSYRRDERPSQWRSSQAVHEVHPEKVRRDQPAWIRHELHNAANPLHLALREHATPQEPVLYRVAWIGGCVMYRRRSLLSVGGFGFWRELPAVHCGEDVVAQLRVLEEFGGAGVLPSGAVHVELPTTIGDREHEAYGIVGVSG